MGGYKTLVVIRMRFYWPHIQKDILEWIKSCAQCIAAGLKMCINSGLSRLWPITTPFAIISIAICSPGKKSNCYGQKKLLNVMGDVRICDLYYNYNDSILVLNRIFMEHVFIIFGAYLRKPSQQLFDHFEPVGL